jgi:ABC-type phosphate transport system substrate-binding protein
MRAILLALTVGMVGTHTSVSLGHVAQDQPFVVIVNASRGPTTLNKTQVSLYFLKKVSRWNPDGEARVEPVDLAESSPVRTAFSKMVHGRSTSAIKSYWEEQIFSGTDSPPIEEASEADAIAYVRAHPNAIGYVSGAAASAAVAAGGVRIVTVTGL